MLSGVHLFALYRAREGGILRPSHQIGSFKWNFKYGLCLTLLLLAPPRRCSNSQVVQGSHPVQHGLKWFRMVAQPERKRRERCRQKKTLDRPPHFYGSIFFCILFFSLCSYLSIWSGRQVVPDSSWCYIPIFDGLVMVEKVSLQWNE